MRAEHFEILAEEPSMEAFLKQALPKILKGEATFAVHAYQGKTDLLSKLGSRLRGYSRWLPTSARIIILVDRDDDDCRKLKSQLEQCAAEAGLITRTTAGGLSWQVVNRIVIEELEAWFFGEWIAMRQAFPKLSPNAVRKAAFRSSDAITGGTWEALERIMQKAGYFSGGLRKVECADAFGLHHDPAANTSPSFIAFREAVSEAMSA